MEPLDFTNLSLPEAIWNCGPPPEPNIRYFDEKDIRDPYLDNRCVVALWRKFGDQIIQNRRGTFYVDSLAMAQTYVGGGRLLEATVTVAELPLFPLLPREKEMTLPAGINFLFTIDNNYFGAVFQNKQEFYEKMIFCTSNPDGTEILNLENFESFMNIFYSLETNIQERDLINNRTFIATFSTATEGTYD